MGKQNKSGIQAKCKHCKYVWFYTGFQPITSCPHCSWRVRINEIEYNRLPDFSESFLIIDNGLLDQIGRTKQKSKVERNKNYRYLQQQQKIKCLSHYSNGDPKCAYPGCNVNDIDLLTIDHINGDGWKHKQKGSKLYYYLIKQHFPKGFKVLCFNHNFLEAKQKGFFGRGKQYDLPPVYPT